MKHKTAELEGALLDAAVSIALGLKTYGTANGRPYYRVPDFIDCPSEDQKYGDEFTPSTRDDHAGPIIDRERIMTSWEFGNPFAAVYQPNQLVKRVFGPTRLVAAMRAFCASKFGDEVEI